MSNERPKKSIKIMVFGTFDGVHLGHLNFFKQARELAKSSELIVSVARDQNVKKIKKKLPIFNEKKRISILKKLKVAKKVILSDLVGYTRHIQKISPDIIALGYDQRAYVANLKKDLARVGLKTTIVRLKPYKKHIYKNSLLRKTTPLR